MYDFARLKSRKALNTPVGVQKTWQPITPHFTSQTVKISRSTRRLRCTRTEDVLLKSCEKKLCAIERIFRNALHHHPGDVKL